MVVVCGLLFVADVVCRLLLDVCLFWCLFLVVVVCC